MRDCGECIACCTYLKISALEKPGLTNCQYVQLTDESTRDDYQYKSVSGGKNCTVFENRPRVCRDYACMWIAGYGEEEDRPDKSGVLIDTIHAIENAIECKPLWEGADTEEAGKTAIKRMAKSSGMAALVTTFKETRLVKVIV